MVMSPMFALFETGGLEIHVVLASYHLSMMKMQMLQLGALIKQSGMDE